MEILIVILQVISVPTSVILVLGFILICQWLMLLLTDLIIFIKHLINAKYNKHNVIVYYFVVDLYKHNHCMVTSEYNDENSIKITLEEKINNYYLLAYRSDKRMLLVSKSILDEFPFIYIGYELKFASKFYIIKYILDYMIKMSYSKALEEAKTNLDIMDILE